MKYRLNSAENISVTLYNVAKTKTVNGKDIVTYSNYIKLVPGTEYETDDKALIDWFKAYRREVRYSKSLEDTLKANDVPYELKMCRSCGGRIKKISYQMVEVTE